MKFVAFSVVVLCLVQLEVEAQQPFLGKCPEQSVVTNFDVSQYLGKWFEIERYFAIFELFGKCVTAEYSLNDDGSIKVLNQQVRPISSSPAAGRATLVETPNNEAKLNVAFGNAPQGSSEEGNYWVLDTDYTNYTIVWSCSDFIFFNTQFLWILTRQQNPSEEDLSKYRSIIKSRGLDLKYLKTTDQTNCS